MFSLAFTTAICLTLAFSVLVIVSVISNRTISITLNPFVAQFGRYHNSLLLWRYRITITRHA